MRLSNSRSGAFEAALTLVPGGAIVAWHDTRDGNAEIYVREVAEDGAPAGPERRVTNGLDDSYEASIDSLHDGSVALAWYDKTATGALASRLGLWTRDRGLAWTIELGPGRNPVVRSDGETIVCAWIRNDPQDLAGETIWLRRWTASGTPVGAPRLLGPAHETTWNLNMAVDEDGTAWVVFDAVASTRASELFVAKAGTGTSTLVRLTADDGRESKYPDIALSDGRAALTWYDAKAGNTEIYLFVGDGAELSEDIESQARRVTVTQGESIGAYLTWNGERVGLAWSDDTEGQHEVYFQTFDAAGRPARDATRITSNPMSSLIPAIVPWRDGFGFAWNDFVPSPGAHDGASEIAFAVVP